MRGRAGLSEFWLFMLFAMVAAIAMEALATLTEGGWVIRDLWSLYMLIPTLAATSRRLHDSGRSVLILVLAAACYVSAGIFLSRSLILAIYNPGEGMWRLLDDPNFAIGIALLGASLVLGLVLLVLLILPSRPGANKYGTTFSGIPSA